MSTIAYALRSLAILLVAGFVAVFLFIQATAVYFLATKPAPADLPRADVLIVLSAGLDETDGSLDDATSARTDEGLALWRAGVADRLIMSGGLDRDLGLLIADQMKAYAVAAGVPADRVFAENRSVSTFENARFSYEIAEREGWRRVVVVTDARHLFRSWLLFEFWKGARPFEIVALSPADETEKQAVSVTLWRAIREPLAYPFNVLKVLGQLGLEMMGRGEERIVR